MLEIQLSLCWLTKNLTGMSGGSHLFEALKNNHHHNLKFKQTTFKSQKNKDTSTNTKEINP
jgi:hypothetical protein